MLIFRILLALIVLTCAVIFVLPTLKMNNGEKVALKKRLYMLLYVLVPLAIGIVIFYQIWPHKEQPNIASKLQRYIKDDTITLDRFSAEKLEAREIKELLENTISNYHLKIVDIKQGQTEKVVNALNQSISVEKLTLEDLDKKIASAIYPKINLSSIKTVTIKDCNNCIAALKHLEKWPKSTTKLYLINSNLQAISTFPQMPSTLKSITINKCFLDDNILSMISKVMSRNIKTIDFSNNRLDTRAIPSIKMIFDLPKVEWFDISYNHLNKEDAYTLIKYANNKENFKYLNVARNKYTDLERIKVRASLQVRY